MSLAMRTVRMRIAIATVVVLGGAMGTAVSSTSASASPTVTIHGQATNMNPCTTTLNPPVTGPTASTLKVRISSDAAPEPHHAKPITLSNTQVAIAGPSAFLLQAYEAGIVANGQAIPATLALEVAGSNTTQGLQAYPVIDASPTVTVHDPDGIPHSGDETVEPLRFAKALPDTSWNSTRPGRPVHFTEASAVLTLTVEVGGTPFVATQTCGVAKPRPFLVVDGR